MGIEESSEGPNSWCISQTVKIEIPGLRFRLLGKSPLNDPRPHELLQGRCQLYDVFPNVLALIEEMEE